MIEPVKTCGACRWWFKGPRAPRRKGCRNHMSVRWLDHTKKGDGCDRQEQQPGAEPAKVEA